jgi:hypothetical protein
MGPDTANRELFPKLHPGKQPSALEPSIEAFMHRSTARIATVIPFLMKKLIGRNHDYEAIDSTGS